MIFLVIQKYSHIVGTTDTVLRDGCHCIINLSVLVFFMLSFLFRKETKQRKAQMAKAPPAICRLARHCID